MSPSVQRFLLAEPLPARAVAQAYFTWLGGAFLGLVRASEEEIRVLGAGTIRLACVEDLPERVTYAVVGGSLAHPGGTFRFDVDGEQVTVTLDEYRTRLPRWLYRLTQAPLHGVVVGWFGRRSGLRG